MTHPSWCDPALCTASDVPPTKYTGDHGRHRSARLDGGDAADGEVYLSQAIAPWECNVVLVIGDRHVTLDYDSPLMWAILAHADELASKYPDLMESGAARAGRPGGEG